MYIDNLYWVFLQNIKLMFVLYQKYFILTYALCENLFRMSSVHCIQNLRLLKLLPWSDTFVFSLSANFLTFQIGVIPNSSRSHHLTCIWYITEHLINWLPEAAIFASNWNSVKLNSVHPIQKLRPLKALSWSDIFVFLLEIGSAKFLAFQHSKKKWFKDTQSSSS